MDKREIVEILEEIAVLHELLGESPFKSRAYSAAARTLQMESRDLAALVASGELRGLKGIGPALADKIATLVTTGRLAYHDELRARVPSGLLDLLRVPGLGPTRVREVHAALGVSSLSELEYAAESRAIQELPRFGAKLQAKILEGIAELKRHADRFLLSDALEQAEAVRAALADTGAVRNVVAAGSLRRRCETVGGVDLVAAAGDARAATEAFRALELVNEPREGDDGDCWARLDGGLRVRLRAVGEAEFPYTLRHLTGSREHNRALEARATERGLRLDERGLWRGGERLGAGAEGEVFAALGLAEIPPELREGRGEIEAAAAGALPALLEISDLQGVLHVHSTWSDGRNSLREMVLAARQRGYRYVGMTDHSQSARYAHGMLPEDVLRQHEEIDRLNEELDGIRVLKGTECDILPDGRLDYPEEILSRFDLVVGSVHSRFGMGETEMTERVLAALASPFLDVLGHPTGRLLLGRAPYAIRLGAVCEAAAERGVAIEINANPHRLDLDWRELRAFRERGGWVSIQPDAHSVEGLDDVAYGVAIARKGWATRERVLNVLSLDELLARFSARRRGAHAAPPAPGMNLPAAPAPAASRGAS